MAHHDLARQPIRIVPAHFASNHGEPQFHHLPLLAADFRTQFVCQQQSVFHDLQAHHRSLSVQGKEVRKIEHHRANIRCVAQQGRHRTKQ